MKPSHVIPFVCDELEISADEFESNDRCQYLVEARWIAAGILTDRFGMSNHMVSKRLGKSPSTISKALTQLKQASRLRPQLARKYAHTLQLLPQVYGAGNVAEQAHTSS